MVFSKRLKEKNFPDMMFTLSRARSLAITREIRQRHGLSPEYFQDYRWIIHLRALVIVATESRAITFLVQMVVLAIIFMLVIFPSPTTINVIILLFILLVPYAVIKSLLFVVYFGKSIDMQDNDFRALFCMPLVASSTAPSSSTAVTGQSLIAQRQRRNGHDEHTESVNQPRSNRSSNSSNDSSIYSILEEKSSDEDGSEGAQSNPYPLLNNSKEYYYNNPQRQHVNVQEPQYYQSDNTKNAHISIGFEHNNSRGDGNGDLSSGYSSEDSIASLRRSDGENSDIIELSIVIDDDDDFTNGIAIDEGGKYGGNFEAIPGERHAAESEGSSAYDSIDFSTDSSSSTVAVAVSKSLGL